MEVTGRKVSWEITAVRVGDGNEKWSGEGTKQGKKSEAQSQMVIDVWRWPS